MFRPMKRARILRYGAVFAVTSCLLAGGVHAGSISPGQGVDLKITQDLQGSDSLRLVLQAQLSSALGGNPQTNGTIQGILDQLKSSRPVHLPANPGGFFAGLIGGGKPGPITIGLPGVNPIPEPRTWVLYALAAVLGAWVVRKELRTTR